MTSPAHAASPTPEPRRVDDLWQVAGPIEPIRLPMRDQATELIRDLIDNKWCQRLRSVRQLGNARLVYPSAEHSRFPHSVETAALAAHAIDDLVRNSPERRECIEQHRLAVIAAALVHDWGHIAPGSHLAYRSIYSGIRDVHEDLTVRILEQDPEVGQTLARYGENLAQTVKSILRESTDVPPWTWQLVSGGGWNVDRGNWTMLDSIMCGIKDGHYDIHSLTGALTVLDDGTLALKERGIKPLSSFVFSRAELYEVVYYHRVVLGADVLFSSLANRARLLFDEGRLNFADDVMAQVLRSSDPRELPLDSIFQMREAWWEYHALRWRNSDDPILSDLAARVADRKLLKTVVLPKNSDERAERIEGAKEHARALGFDPEYYVRVIERNNVTKGDFKKGLQLLLESGERRRLSDGNSVFRALASEPADDEKAWLVVPGAVRERLRA